MGQVQSFQVAAMAVIHALSLHDALPISLVALPPLFVTVSVKLPVPPRWNVGALAVFEVVRSGGAAAVFTVAVAELLAGVVSPPPPTVAVFVSCAGAFEATLTFIVIAGKLAPAFNASARVQFTLCPVMGQVQPFPVAVVGANPVGSGSSTVTVPLVALPPLLVTVSVKLPVPPRWNVG